MRASVQEMLDHKVVSIVCSKPVCVSPITVAVRKLPTGKQKKHFCWDGSRMINKCVNKEMSDSQI